MSYQLACSASDRIASIVSLAGSNWFDPSACAASEPVSVLQVHGTEDRTILYDGGTLNGASYPGAEISVAYWVDLAECDDVQADGTRDYDRLVSGSETERIRWDCGDIEVRLWNMVESRHLPALTDAWKDDVVTWMLDR